MIEYTVMVYADGDIYWLNKDGQRHCEHGPAVEKANGDKSWFLNGNLHCEHGPAVEKANGVAGYYLNDERLTKEEWENRLKRPCSGKIVEIDGVKYKLMEV